MVQVKPIDFDRIIKSRYLVKLSRKPLEKRATYGFILSCSESLILLHELETSSFTLNGYSVLRNEDISLYAVYDRPDYYFDSRVLKLKGISPEPRPEISIANLPELITSVSKHYPLFSIFREEINDEVFVGRLAAMTPKTFTLLEVDDCAEWIGRHRYRFKDITQVGFGSGYEEALALIVAEDTKKKSKGQGKSGSGSA